MTCRSVHKERLFIGEAGFKGVYSLLERHAEAHPNLGESITATELATFGRDSDSCPRCPNEDDIISIMMQKFFSNDEPAKRTFFVVIGASELKS